MNSTKAEKAGEYREILKLVKQMRTFQKYYFKYCRKEDLIESKRLEKRVDTRLEETGI